MFVRVHVAGGHGPQRDRLRSLFDDDGRHDEGRLRHEPDLRRHDQHRRQHLRLRPVRIGRHPRLGHHFGRRGGHELHDTGGHLDNASLFN